MQHYIFNYSNFKEMGIDVKKIKFYTVCMPVCVIRFKDNNRRKIHLTDVTPVMNQARKHRAKIEKFSIYPGEGYYRCWSKDNLYWLTPTEDTIECTCKDYEMISQIISDDLLCKHGHALLNKLNMKIYSEEYYELAAEMEERSIEQSYEDTIEYYRNKA